MTEHLQKSLGAVLTGEKAHRPPPPDPVRRRWRGCLLGGAVGDALGAPVEFMSLAEIRERFGPAGVVDYTTAFDRQGAITDDTQMSLYTAEGLLRAHVKSALDGTANVPAIVAHAYARWLATQDHPSPLVDTTGDQGVLAGVAALRARRVPGHTCIEALAALGAYVIDRLRERFGLHVDRSLSGLAEAVAARTDRPVGKVMRMFLEARDAGKAVPADNDARDLETAWQMCRLLEETGGIGGHQRIQEHV